MLFQWMGLLLPLLLLVNMALLILWIVRRRAWFFFPLMALIANYSYYPTIFQIRFGDTSRQDTLSPIVMGTYNVRSFRMDYGGSSLMNIAELIQEKKVNILCLQEVPSDLDRQSLAKAFSFLPYRVYTDSADTGFNVLILTKFPVKNIRPSLLPNGQIVPWSQIWILTENLCESSIATFRQPIGTKGMRFVPVIFWKRVLTRWKWSRRLLKITLRSDLFKLIVSAALLRHPPCR
jgi:hypothetical protein